MRQIAIIELSAHLPMYPMYRQPFCLFHSGTDEKPTHIEIKLCQKTLSTNRPVNCFANNLDSSIHYIVH